MNTNNDLLKAVLRITYQLDERGNPDLRGLPEVLCRALKVQEEAGELAQAVIGVLGQNPRKGVTHTWDHVVGEALDTALSALVLAETIVHLHGDHTLDERLSLHLDVLRHRAAQSGAPDVPVQLLRNEEGR